MDNFYSSNRNYVPKVNFSWLSESRHENKFVGRLFWIVLCYSKREYVCMFSFEIVHTINKCLAKCLKTFPDLRSNKKLVHDQKAFFISAKTETHWSSYFSFWPKPIPKPKRFFYFSRNQYWNRNYRIWIIYEIEGCVVVNVRTKWPKNIPQQLYLFF